jgi:signal transduction histidine kinase
MDRPNLGVPVVLLLMVSTVMMAILTFVGARSLDQSAEASAHQMAASLLAQTKYDLAKVARDLSWSDLLRRPSDDGSGAAWTDPDLGRYLHRTFNLSSSWVVDAADATVFGEIGDKSTAASAFEVMPSGLKDLVQQARAAPASEPNSVHGLLLFNGDIHVVAAAQITPAEPIPEQLPGAKHPVLVLTRALHRKILSALDAVYFVSGADLVSGISPSGKVAVTLKNPNGDVLGYLTLDIVAPGAALLRQVWPAVASAFASMLLLVGLFVRRVERARQQRVLLEENLDRERDLRQLKSRFVNMVSHEIRTPLTTIRAATDLLTRYGQKMKGEEREAELKAIQREVDVMTELVEDVLTIGRTEGEAFELQPQRLDLETIAREIWADLERAHGRHQPIELEVEPAAREVTLDPSLLRLILSNILGNALKFSPDGTPIEVSLGVGDGGVVIRVRDHGIGIPADQQEAVFTPFHRAPNVGAISGSGLGLTITKQSVERLGGTLQLSSREGEGTEVLVRLPLAA